MSEIATVSPFEALGTNLRFGTTEDGTPFVVAADFARALDYRDAERALRLLDDDERGTHLVGTSNGRTVEMGVIYEDGIWELIFRSTKPEAKLLKKRVKQILAEIRETGSYNATPAIATPDLATAEGVLVMAEQFAATARRLVLAETKVAELAPAAESWNTLATAEGDFLVADAAKILSRDPNIKIGQNRLFTKLGELGWIYRAPGDQKWRTKQSAIESGRISEIPMTHYHPRTGALILDPPQIRVTVKGMERLHQHLRSERGAA